MNIDEMPPGADMDRAIARAVFGRDLWITSADEFWEPSENIAHAWEVAEKLRLMVFPNKSGWAAAKARYDSAGEGPSHGETWIDESLDHYAEASTAALAICRCALKAAGVK